MYAYIYVYRKAHERMPGRKEKQAGEGQRTRAVKKKEEQHGM
jgi:hypothetical protein